jgi:hypothetical protein
MPIYTDREAPRKRVRIWSVQSIVINQASRELMKPLHYRLFETTSVCRTFFRNDLLIERVVYAKWVIGVD